MRQFSNEELKKKAEFTVAKVLTTVNYFLESTSNELTDEEDKGAFLCFLAAAGQRGLSTLYSEAGLEMDETMNETRDLMKIASESVYGT